MRSCHDSIDRDPLARTAAPFTPCLLQGAAGRWLRAGCAMLVLLAPGLAPAQSDADIVAAKAAFERGDVKRLEAIAAGGSGHLLEPYVRAWLLRLTVDTADASTLRAFLAANAGTPYANELRADWLKSLGRAGQWAMFEKELGAYTGEDVEIACNAALMRVQRDGAKALADAKGLWATGRATPDACDALFGAMFAAGVLTADDRRMRFRLATEAGQPRLAQALAREMPAPERIAERDLVRVETDPIAAVNRGEFAFRTPAGRDLAVYAVERAARKDPAAARIAWLRWRDKLPAPERAYGNARVGFYAARAHLADAHLMFRDAGNVAMGDEQHAWRVRAALRAGAWPDVLAAVDAMPATLAEDAAWRYWRARALHATGKADDAGPLFEKLAGEYHFYGLLAAEALQRPLVPLSQPLDVSDEALASFGAKPAVKRVVKLAQLDLRMEMIREWIIVVRGLDDASLLTAAEFTRRAGLYDRAINTAERTASRHDFALRYLMPYGDAFRAASREHDVELALLFAIARQESRFNPSIVSSAGAQGLMQLMPATARWIAKQLNQPDYRPERVTDIDLNTRYGAFYIGYLLERLDRHPALAAAAYNAGPGRAQAWRPPGALEGAIWVESIPFNETRDYVKKVLSNATFYARALGRQPMPLTAVLGTVGPRPSVSGPVATAGKGPADGLAP